MFEHELTLFLVLLGTSAAFAEQPPLERLAQWSDDQIYQNLWAMLSPLFERVNLFLAALSG